MFSKFLLIITSLAYMALLAINMYKPKGTGDQMVGWGYIVMLVLSAYAICSLVLTINVVYNGKFDWISESSLSKYFIVGLCWLLFTVGIAVMTSINVDWGDSRSSNWLGLVMVHYGVIWFPLLMLAPYFILINLEYSDLANPNIVKMPLLIGSIIGAAFLFLSKNQLSNVFIDSESLQTLQYGKDLKDIETSTNAKWLLYYLDEDKDPKLQQAATAKLKSLENLDSSLIDFMKNCESSWDYTYVYVYMEKNKLENPAIFIQPFIYTLNRVASELNYLLQSNTDEKLKLEKLNVARICQILETQFKPYKNEFHPYILKIQEVLNKDPHPQFLEIRNKYKEAIDSWLAL